MKNKDNWREELKDISPYLYNLKSKPEGYDVPADYFHSLKDDVLSKVHFPNEDVAFEKESWFDNLASKLRYFIHPRYALAYASVILLLVVGVYYVKNTMKADSDQPLLAEAILAQVPDEILQDYIVEHIDAFDQSWLAEELNTGDEESLPVFDQDETDELLDEIINDLDIDDLKDLL